MHSLTFRIVSKFNTKVVASEESLPKLIMVRSSKFDKYHLRDKLDMEFQGE